MKNINYFKWLKSIILIVLIYTLLFNFDLYYQIIIWIFDYLMIKFNEIGILNTFIQLLIQLILVMLVCKLLKVWFGKWYYRHELKHSNMKKNTYSKGHARFQKLEETKKNFVWTDYHNHNTDGYLIAQYKEYKTPIGKHYYPHFEVKSRTMVGNEELSNAEQIKLLKESMKNVSYKEKIISKCSLSYRNVLLIDPNPVHELVIATTRAGKTQTLVITQIDYLSSIKDYDKKPHLIISDPKGELFENTSKDLEARGYEILAINLKNLDLSHSYNPLEVIKVKHQEELEKNNFDISSVYDKLLNTMIINELSNTLDMELNELKHLIELEGIKGLINKISDRLEPEELMIVKNEIEKIFLSELEKITFAISESEIIKLSNYLVPEPEKGDPVFAQGAKKILNSYIKYVWEQSFIFGTVEETFNLYAVMNQVQHGSRLVIDTPKMKKTFYQLEMDKRDKNSFARLQHPSQFMDNPYDSFMSNLTSRLQIFQSIDVGRLISRNQVDFHKIAEGKKPYGIYLITPDYDTKYNMLVSTFISQLYLTAVEDAEKYYGGKLPRKMHLILEEFANIPKIDQLTAKMTVCLGRGIQFMLVIQNKQQLISVYGEDDATTILDNTHNKIYLLAGDGDTREWFSNQLGKTTILNQSYSGKEVSEMSMTTSEEEKALVSPYDLNLNPLGQMYASVTKQHPLKLHLRPAFTYLQNDKTTEEEFFKTHKNLHSEIKHANEITI